MTQARRAFDEALTAAQRTVDTLEGNASTAQAGAREAGRMMLSYTSDMVEDAFDLVQGLLRAGDARAVMSLQQDFMKKQMERTAERARKMTEAAVKAGFGMKPF